MIQRTWREIFIIFISILTAFGLSLLPIPITLSPFIPDWVLLTLIYWMIYSPKYVGFSIVWLCGLLTDVLTNSLLGEHAAASIFVAYFTLKFYRRIRLSSVWQQVISIGLLLAMYRFILFWIQGIIQQPISNEHWISIVTGTLIWPVFLIVLNESKYEQREM